MVRAAYNRKANSALRQVVAPGGAQRERVGLDRREVERLVVVDLHILGDGERGKHDENTGEHGGTYGHDYLLGGPT